MHAIRGATSVPVDDADALVAASRELLERMVGANRVHVDDVVSVIFTVTPDLSSAFPARAAREMGWNGTPLLCMQEIDVPGALPRCVRVLMHVEFAVPRARVSHVYLRDAVALRPELAADGLPHPVPATTAEPAPPRVAPPLAPPVAPRLGDERPRRAVRRVTHAR